MILIVESGSTKCNWVLLDSDKHQYPFTTQGINPYFNDETFIVEQLLGVETVINHATSVAEIQYFGAGSTDARTKGIIISALKKVFPNACEISCESDLKAAAFATWSGSPSIVSILGTGANTAYFDGEALHYQKPALGYILGDEASGAYFGKQLLRAYFYHQLPIEVEQAFEAKYALTKLSAFENIYQKPNANAYIASFMPFLISNQSNPYIRQLLRNGFLLYLKTHVVDFKDKCSQLSLVGSVAFFGQEILKEEAEKLGINITNVIQHPIEGLVAYFINRKI